MTQLTSLPTLRSFIRIMEKPNATHRDNLTITRRVLLNLRYHRRAIINERRALRRQARKLRQFLPFTALAVADLERQAHDHRAAEYDALRRALIAYGQSIIHDREGIAAALSFDQLADHLNINPVHREQARIDGGDTLQGLAFIARMEDSADRQSEAWGDGGPLFEACMAATADFIRTCPEHRLPDPFAPGEMFGPKLPPQLRVVS
ncbi:hypothetical protein [Pseudomonas sp. TMP25]|uniref:hypothetical protein n=1 Tax=Pseudomonas sp. TMP25 TaxID=3136561 RepID=UPI0031010C6E